MSKIELYSIKNLIKSNFDNFFKRWEFFLTVYQKAAKPIFGTPIQWFKEQKQYYSDTVSLWILFPGNKISYIYGIIYSWDIIISNIFVVDFMFKMYSWVHSD